MRIVATSDLHGNLPEIPECDLLLIAGDIVPDNFTVGEDYWTPAEQKAWIKTVFNPWLREDVPAKHKVVIGGNHDYVLQKQNLFTGSATYLKDQLAVVEGLRIWGSPYCPTFGNWAFMKPDHLLADHWRMIPRDIDILMVHGPAWGFNDLVGEFDYERKKYSMENAEHVGSSTLSHQLYYEEWPNLKLFVHGHIHSQYGNMLMGIMRDSIGDRENVPVYNCSYVNYKYEPSNEPWVIDL